MDSNTAKKIKSKNTGIERRLGKAMWARGLRYRKHCNNILGNPDFCFRKKKVVVFCDSEFWHGKTLLEGQKFKTNPDYWNAKISRNIERDKQTNKTLKKAGWTVLRFWGKDIEKNLEHCVYEVECQVNKRC